METSTAARVIEQRRTIRLFDETRAVPTAPLTSAVAAAATAPAPHHSRPWRFLRLRRATRNLLLDAMAVAWRNDLEADGTPRETIDQRLQRSDALLRSAPEVLAPFTLLANAHAYPDDRRSRAERDLFVLSGGAALQNLQLVLADHGLGAAWLSSTAFCPGTTRHVLGLDETWQPMGLVAVGYPAPGVELPPRPPIDPRALLIDQ